MLSDRSATILGMVAEGRSYEQILQRRPELTYLHIFEAAREALDLLGRQRTEDGPVAAALPHATVDRLDRGVPERRPSRRRSADQAEPVADIVELAPEPVGRPSFVERARATHARAWARWTRDEDVTLTRLFGEGTSVAEIGRELGRHDGAIPPPQSPDTRSGDDGPAFRWIDGAPLRHRARVGGDPESADGQRLTR